MTFDEVGWISTASCCTHPTARLGGFLDCGRAGASGIHYATTAECSQRGREITTEGRTPKWTQEMADAFFRWTGVMTHPHRAIRHEHGYEYLGPQCLGFYRRD